MGSFSLSCLVVTFVSFGVYGSCVACSIGTNNFKGILGRNINLTCNMKYQCDSIRWDKPTLDGVLQPSGESVKVGPSISYLLISGISLDDDGDYRCFCFVGSERIDMCQVHLKTICQAMVTLGGGTNLYNSSSPSRHFINVAAGNVISIACDEDARLEDDCAIEFLPASNKRQSHYIIQVLPIHDSCQLICRLNSESGTSCNVTFTLNVTDWEKSTQPVTTSTSASNVSPESITVVTASAQPSERQSTSTIIPNYRYIFATGHTTMPVLQDPGNGNAIPEKFGSFPVIIFVGISIVVFVGILCMICFFIYFSRSKSSSRQKKTQTPDNKSPDINIPIGPTYATVSKSAPGCTEGDDDSERCIPCADDAYAEVDSSGQRESSTQQVNAVKAETSITKDYYSVVNTSTTKLEQMDSGNKSDSVLYTEVNKGDNQAGKKVGTSSPGSSDCSPNVADVQSYDVLGQPESSEYDDVGVVSTSPALYSVVDKERKKD